ncbi:MAG: valine--tRNA ligase [Deltaproteobacteria bacterium]|nr:MAG: valine--tRNA ligase [Deltaproteobacteria bacterium]
MYPLSTKIKKNQDILYFMLSPKYDTKTLEPKWNKIFQAPFFFSSSNTSVKKKYSILMPPPNATGILHSGHALFITIQDILIRFNRLKGFNTIWTPGIDHAGIATQNIIEKNLHKNGITKESLGRSLFIKKTYDWVHAKTSFILPQMRNLGASANWDKIRFTLDHAYAATVSSAFVSLWNNHLIYRGERLVNWDSLSQTAISDEEVSHDPQQGTLFYISYKIHNSSEHITVATTRPETIPGDTAIAIHPSNTHLSHLLGKYAIHPLWENRLLPIIADNYVDPKFGSGVIKITPAHDLLDFEIAERHNLQKITIFTQTGMLNSNCLEYSNLDKNIARNIILQKLQSLKLIKKNHSILHNVRISSRNGSPIELLISKQFFLKTKDLAINALNTVLNNEIKIIPSRWKKVFEHFMTNIQDWCISRQLWWGHRIPIYYKLEDINPNNLENLSDSKILSIATASTENLEKKYPLEYRQETDVLDTWFSSALWPISTISYSLSLEEILQYYPTSVLETGSDILFFWVARMIMLGTYFTKKPPFSTIFLHNIIRDAYGKKISKSIGNAIDPFDIINGNSLKNIQLKLQTNSTIDESNKILTEYQNQFPNGIPACGVDGFRFGLSTLCDKGNSIKLNIHHIVKHKAFLNKIWNASRYILCNLNFQNISPLYIHEAHSRLSIEDLFILSKLQHCIKKVNKNISNFQFSKAALALQKFFWHEFCDWYLEISKLKLSNMTTKNILLKILIDTLKLLHPFCPFITEEIWETIPITVSYCSSSYIPQFNKKLLNPNAEKMFALIQNIISSIRYTCHSYNIQTIDKKNINIYLTQSLNYDLINSCKPIISHLTSFSNVNIYPNLNSLDVKTPFIKNSNIDYTIEIQIDKSNIPFEQTQLSRQIKKINNEISFLSNTLNETFLSKAPISIINKKKEKLNKLIYEKNIILSKKTFLTT